MGRCEGCFTRHLARKLWKSLDHLPRSCSVGGSLRGIRTSTRMGFISWWGGCISASSMQVMPALHTSDYREGRGGGGVTRELSVCAVPVGAHFVVIGSVSTDLTGNDFRGHPAEGHGARGDGRGQGGGRE